MTSDQTRNDAERPDGEEEGDAVRTPRTEEPIGAEIGMSDEGTTFEPEEDPEGAAE